jgi:transcriptional regulator with XRE-family HTH domain
VKYFDMQGFSAAVRGRRKMRGLTQRQAAKAIGISDAYLCQIERDQVSIGIDVAVQLAEWLELPIDAFVRERELHGKT